MFAKAIVIFLLLGACTLAKTQSSFPVVERAAQQARDDDRRLILDTELNAERQALVSAKGSLVNGASDVSRAEVHRHEQNVKALERELKAIADVPQSQARAALVTRIKPTTVAQPLKSTGHRASFWNPYNRAAEGDSANDVSIFQRREIQ